MPVVAYIIKIVRPNMVILLVDEYPIAVVPRAVDPGSPGLNNKLK